MRRVVVIFLFSAAIFGGCGVASPPSDETLRDGTKVVFYKRQFDGDWYLTFEHWP